MRVAIVGSRSITDYAVLEDAIRESGFDVRVVVSGGAHGVDTLAAEYASVHGLNVIVYKPDWDTHGRSAGFVRNKRIVDAADALIAVWDGRSRGTQHSVKLALARGIPTYVHNPDSAVNTNPDHTGQ